MSERRAARDAQEQPKERGVWAYILAGLSAGLLLIVVGIAAMVIVVPWVTNSVALTVLTQSMAPTYPPGTLVVVRPVPPNEVRIGDVITYQTQPGVAEYITHRVVAITRSTTGDLSFTTKGDANSATDPQPIIADQVKGTVWYSLPWIGWLNNAVGGEGKTWLVIGLAVVLFAYAGWQFFGSVLSRRKKAAPAVESTAEPAAEPVAVSAPQPPPPAPPQSPAG